MVWVRLGFNSSPWKQDREVTLDGVLRELSYLLCRKCCTRRGCHKPAPVTVPSDFRTLLALWSPAVTLNAFQQVGTPNKQLRGCHPTPPGPIAWSVLGLLGVHYFACTGESFLD